MAFESVRSYIQLANGLGEMTRARAMEAAQGLLALPGADEVTRRAVQASTLADQLLEAAKANRASLLALVQSEVESALRHADVARVGDLESARAALSGLAKEVAELRSTVAASVLNTGAAAVAGAARTPGVRSAAVTTASRPQPAQTATKATAKKATAKKATVKKATGTRTAKATAKKAGGTGTRAAKATAKKATAKKAAGTGTRTTKTTAKKATAKKAGGTGTRTTKATTRKSTAKKATQ